MTSLTANSGTPLTALVLGNRSDAVARASWVVHALTRRDPRSTPAAATMRTPSPFPPPTNTAMPLATRSPGRISSSSTHRLNRTIPHRRERRALEVRAEADNIFNIVSISNIGTTLNGADLVSPPARRK